MTKDFSVSRSIAEQLLTRGISVTVENYLAYAYPDWLPDPLPASIMHEAEEAVRYAASIKAINL